MTPMTEIDLIAKYDQMVPRYTSYPTAPHFSPAIGPDDYAAWLAEVPKGTPLSLYLHIPYCDTMCWFCGCTTKIVNRYEPIKAYLEWLCAEIAMVAERLKSRHPATYIHWGGGTPTILKPADILILTDTLRRHFDFAPNGVFAVEIDPREMTRDIVTALAKAGVTRASLGVQDFNPDVQKAINRIQPYEMTKQVIDWLRADGIEEINLDLMYGLPYQSEAGIIETVDRALTLEPSRLALFGYAHVPWMKKHQKLIDEAALPDSQERWAQYTAAREHLIGKGFVPVGLDHFTRNDDSMAVALKSGKLRRNFQGYTTDTSDILIGLGASAIGSLPQGYVQNAPHTNHYRDAITQGRLATAKGIAVSDEDRLRRYVIERLMCDTTIDLGAACRKFNVGENYFADEIERLDDMIADGILTIEKTDASTVITLTPMGLPLVRTVGAIFDTYLESGIGRHAKAV
jgi:oxygen-independent coproporphyrinogen III oxidase